MRVLVPCLALGLLVGCANVVTSNFPKAPAGPYATVVVYREKVMGAGAVAAHISLDGREIASIRREMRLEVKVAPGLRVVGVGIATMPINAEAGQTYFLSIDPSESVMLKLKTKEEAAPRLGQTIVLASNQP